MRELVVRKGVSFRRMTAVTGAPTERVAEAIRGLAAEGLVRAAPAALAGKPGGLIRLP